MNRTYVFLAALAAAAALAGGVHLVLWIAQVAEPAATTVQGPTTRRLWASAAAALALAGAAGGAIAWLRPASRFGTRRGIFPVILAGAAGMVNGGFVLALADGGPGSGNGVVGGAAAVALGLVAVGFGYRGLTRADASAGAGKSTRGR